MSHLSPLDPDAGFALWRAFVVRSAGFPAVWATELHSDDAVRAARVSAEAIARYADLKRELRDELHAALRAASGASKRPIRKLLNKLDGDRTLELLGEVDDPLRSQAERLVQHARLRDDALVAYQETYERELSRVTALLQEAVRRGRMREAIAWESLGALDAIDKFLAAPPEQLDKKTRERCIRALSYLQRLCMKNDSIGFFGPIAWGTFDDDIEVVELDIGEPLVARHEHYFESWALNHLARPLAEDPATKAWLPVRRLPSMAVVGSDVKLPLQPPVERGPLVATALSLADGSRDSREAAQELSRRGLASPAEAAQLIDALEAEGLLFRLAELPQAYDADEILRERLARMPAASSAPHLARLDKIDDARARVAAACGDADALSQALGDLQRVFENETGQAGSRGGGGFYEARSPLFQEALRNITLGLGRRVLADLRGPLSLLLRVIRWYTQTIAGGVIDRVERLLARGATPRVEFLQVFSELVGELTGIARAAAEEMRQRWREAILPLAGAGAIDVAAARAAIDGCFPRLPVRWELARHASPDLMIAAGDIEDIRRGAYLVVLGEVHVAVNTLLFGLLHWAHEPSKLADWMLRDMKRPPILGDWAVSESSVRNIRPQELYGAARFNCFIPHHRNTQWRDEYVIPLASLHIERDAAGEAVARCATSGRHWRVADVFNPQLAQVALDAFRLTAEAGRSQRLQLGSFVVQRAQWSFSPKELAFASLKAPSQRFAELQAFLYGQQLPRHAFVRIQSEKKPIYIDFQSPLYGELFSKLVRNMPDGGAPLTISEMLPGPDQLWLRDRQGNRYTAELRCVAVDTG